MAYEVDGILNNWFGEPPDHSDQEAQLLRHLYEPLRKLERRLRELERAHAEASWVTSPDRMGGQFTPEELDNSNTWR
jgi:hypothetical protein